MVDALVIFAGKTTSWSILHFNVSIINIFLRAVKFLNFSSSVNSYTQGQSENSKIHRVKMSSNQNNKDRDSPYAKLLGIL